MHKPHTLYSRDPKTGKYTPVAEYETFDYLREGEYMLSIKPGLTSMRTRLYAGRYTAEFEALLNSLKDKLCEALMRHYSTPKVYEKMTKAQLDAFAVWKKAFKSDFVVRPSISEAVENAIQEVVAEAKK